jgi:hypothetical protein
LADPARTAFERIGAPLDEHIERKQILAHNFQIAMHKNLAAA